MRRNAAVLCFSGILLTAVSAAAPAAADQAPHHPGTFSQECTWSHQNFQDPILFPGDTGNPAHQHEYFDNRSTDGSSTSASLRAPGPMTTCNAARSFNRSAYWAPALYLGVGTTERLQPDLVRVYYRDGGLEPPSNGGQYIETPPADFRMIAGNAMQSELVDQRTDVMQWSCVVEGREEEEDEPASHIPLSCDDTSETDYTGELRMRVVFPNCWNGTSPWQNANEPGFNGKDHVRYAWQNNQGEPQGGGYAAARAQCPSHFPHQLPEITVGVRWTVGDGSNGTFDLTNAHLASDAHHPGVSTRGGTGHADFMNGWDQTELNSLIDYCIRAVPQVDCGDDERAENG